MIFWCCIIIIFFYLCQKLYLYLLCFLIVNSRQCFLSLSVHFCLVFVTCFNFEHRFCVCAPTCLCMCLCVWRGGVYCTAFCASIFLSKMCSTNKIRLIDCLIDSDYRQAPTVATWNIWTMYRVGKTWVIADEMRRYKISVLSVHTMSQTPKR